MAVHKPRHPFNQEKVLVCFFKSLHFQRQTQRLENLPTALATSQVNNIHAGVDTLFSHQSPTAIIKAVIFYHEEGKANELSLHLNFILILIKSWEKKCQHQPERWVGAGGKKCCLT